jgi:hypothetical protein
MPESETLEITMVKAVGEAILTTRLAASIELLRQPEVEIRLESVDLTENE